MDTPRKSAGDPAALMAEAVSIMARLRAPGGCPWDREQTFDSIKPYTLEETYEVFDAIDRRHWRDLRDELGDLLLQVLFYSQMAAEAGYFTIAEVIGGLNGKLIRRHPHVFENRPADGIDSAEVLRNWERIKRGEKADRPQGLSALDSIPRSLPALIEARKLGSSAHRSGFDWPGPEGLFSKLEEEANELRQAILHHQADSAGEATQDISSDATRTAASEAVVSEIGDLLFTVVNLARHLHVDPEFALRHTNVKFRRRFSAMETSAPSPLVELSPDQLESLWNQVKLKESNPALANS